MGPGVGCETKTALDVVRGPTVDNAMMCALNAQTMIAGNQGQTQGAEMYSIVILTGSISAAPL